MFLRMDKDDVSRSISDKQLMDPHGSTLRGWLSPRSAMLEIKTMVFCRTDLAPFLKFHRRASEFGDRQTTLALHLRSADQISVLTRVVSHGS